MTTHMYTGKRRIKRVVDKVSDTNFGLNKQVDKGTIYFFKEI